jgi:hypothetical protein
MSNYVYETESEDNMTNIKRKVLSVAIIILGILIISPTLYAQNQNNNRGRQQRVRTVLRQNMQIRQHPGLRANRIARQNWWLRLINRIQRRNIWRLRAQVRQNRIELRREYRRHYTRNHHNYNNNYNNNHWGRP